MISAGLHSKGFNAAVTCQDSVLMALWLASLGEALKGAQHCIGHCSAHRGLMQTIKFLHAHAAEIGSLMMVDRKESVPAAWHICMLK